MCLVSGKPLLCLPCVHGCTALRQLNGRAGQDLHEWDCGDGIFPAGQIIRACWNRPAAMHICLARPTCGRLLSRCHSAEKEKWQSWCPNQAIVCNCVQNCRAVVSPSSILFRQAQQACKACRCCKEPWRTTINIADVLPGCLQHGQEPHLIAAPALFEW